MIFAREVSDSLTSLVKKIDAATVNNSGCKMGSFVVFCNDDEDLKDKLAKLAEKEGLKKCILTIDKPDGPPDYEVAKDADVTVVYYNRGKVIVNRAFKKGELTEKAVNDVVSEIVKKLPMKDEKKSDD
jgi:hypothetical protein